MNTFTRRKFIKMTTGGIALAAYSGNAFGEAGQATTGKVGPDLSSIGKKFRFVIIADPHINPKNAPKVVASTPEQAEKQRVGLNSERTLQEAIGEINAMETKPTFVVHLGDMTNVPNQPSIDTWVEYAQVLKPTQVLVHGNHDGSPPYDSFLAMQKKITGYSAPFFSFDCGAWHFVAIPCNLNGQHPDQVEMERQMFAFLESDIEQSKDKPTIIFHHYHFLPVGLSQTEWYFYNLGTRKRLLELYSRHGNVKWAFNGHVHNGILASEKTSWNYRGINFINCPTIVLGRPFGEEHPGFEKGLSDGGYYVVVDIDGDKVDLQGKLAGKSEAYPFPATFQEFKEELEPRIFHTIGELPAAAALSNGDFSQGLSQWLQPWRYLRADKPVYTADVVDDSSAPGRKALAITTREGGIPQWAKDEYDEAYQIVSLATLKNPLVSLSYKLNQPPSDGGGYLRLEFLRDKELLALMMFYWGAHEELANFYPQCVGYALTGVASGWTYFQKLAKQKQGFYWRLPMVTGKWHSLAVNTAKLYGQALNDPDAFAKAQPDKLSLAVGTWNNRDLGTRSEALFSGITLADAAPDSASHLDGTPLAYTSDSTNINFGDDLTNRMKGHKKISDY